ncbi:MAG: CHAP domain-containing protein [Sediminibacterium sp.]
MNRTLLAFVFLLVTTTLFAQKKIGDVVDEFNGVKVYYNGSVSHVSTRNVSADGYNIGLRYQCVEFVKRYYYEYFKHKMPNSYGHAKDFYNSKFKDGQLNTERNLIQYKNGGQGIPQSHDLIVWKGNEWNPYGHVAIVVNNNGNKSITIIQQNPGPNAPSRITLNLIYSGSGYTIDDDEILGWLHKN